MGQNKLVRPSRRIVNDYLEPVTEQEVARQLKETHLASDRSETSRCRDRHEIRVCSHIAMDSRTQDNRIGQAGQAVTSSTLLANIKRPPDITISSSTC